MRIVDMPGWQSGLRWTRKVAKRNAISHRNITLPPGWKIVPEVADGTFGFRSIARSIYGSPQNHETAKTEILDFMSTHRNEEFAETIPSGTGEEHIYQARKSYKYKSLSDYIAIMKRRLRT